MSTILVEALSLASSSSSLALACSSMTVDLNTEAGSVAAGTALVSLNPSSGMMIWDTLLEMLDLAISSLARVGNSDLSSADSSSLAHSFTKQI